MDSKGLDVCNSLERDKACWRCCCLDGRKAACHDGLDSLTVVLRSLRDLGNDVEGTILFSSTVLTPFSDNTDSGFCSPSRSVFAGPKFSKHHGTKSSLGRLG